MTGGKLGGIKQQKCFLLVFWEPEVQNQSISRATLCLKALGQAPSLPLPASGICSTPASAFTWLSPLLCLCLLSL